MTTSPLAFQPSRHYDPPMLPEYASTLLIVAGLGALIIVVLAMLLYRILNRWVEVSK